MTIYRGSDLDLRTPQQPPIAGHRAPIAEPAGSNTYNGSWRSAQNGALGPIWADDTAIACCNHAFDVALAHGAAEVQLEHLVHAMTRVELAARVLEQNGFQDAALRRESAAVIAGQIPYARNGDLGTPRASSLYVDVLHRASEHAGRSGRAAGVGDILWVMSQMSRDIAGVALLMKHSGDYRPHLADHIGQAGDDVVAQIAAIDQLSRCRAGDRVGHRRTGRHCRGSALCARCFVRRRW